jgi:hypothetical protein
MGSMSMEIRIVRKVGYGPEHPAHRLTSPQSEGTHSEVDPTLSGHTHTATGDPGWLFPGKGKAGLSSSEPAGDGVVIVVVGVTSHQGAWESHAQGKGPQTLFLQDLLQTEVLDLNE